MKIMKMTNKISGFTLVEMLLVLVIISIIIYAAIGYQQQRALQLRIDRTSAQMQAVLNASLAFYVANGRWPNDMNELRQNGVFLPPPSVNMDNPWGLPYSIGPSTGVPPSNTSIPMFAVWTRIPGTKSNAIAASIAGILPLSYTSNDGGTPDSGPPPAVSSACRENSSRCYAVGMVSVPGQNLNNARAVNFAGVYKHGGCVPVPQCPLDVTGAVMTPQIMVVPVSVSGVKDYRESDTTHKVYPISSFTAYAVPSAPNPPVANPEPCIGSTAPKTQACNTDNNGPTVNLYWRVCLKVVTELGDIQTTSDRWGKEVSLMAITRCAVTSEPAGTNFNVYSN